MAGYPFRIVTLRIGVEVDVVTRQNRSDADLAYDAAIVKAQRTVDRQKVPRRVELRNGSAVLATADVTCRR